jgi:hypothetical protein
VVVRFNRERPRVRFDFNNCSDPQLREDLNSRRIDLVFCMIDAVFGKAANVRKRRTAEMMRPPVPGIPWRWRKESR